MSSGKEIIPQKESDVVFQSNSASTAFYNYTSAEVDVMFVLIAKLNANTTSKDKIIVSQKHIEELTKRKWNTSELQKAVISGLAKKSFQIESIVERGRNKGSIKHIHRPIFGNLEWIDGTGSFHCYINEWSLPLFINLKQNFTTISLSNLFSLKGYYAKRFYILMNSWKNIYSKKPLMLEELYKILMLENNYSTFGNFNNKVLKPAFSEINSNSDISVAYQEVKASRKVVGLNFTYFKEKVKGEQQLTFDFSPEVDDLSEIEEAEETTAEEIFSKTNQKPKKISEKKFNTLYNQQIDNLNDNEVFKNLIVKEYAFSNDNELFEAINEYMVKWFYQNEFAQWNNQTHFWNGFASHRKHKKKENSSNSVLNHPFKSIKSFSQKTPNTYNEPDV